MIVHVPDEDEECAAALAALDIGPARLRRLLRDHAPSEAWRLLAVGAHPEDPEGRARPAVTPGLRAGVARRCAALGAGVLVHGAPGYPSRLHGDAEAPAVLFSLGDPTVVDRHPCVTVVGTRSASAVGLDAAEEIGRTLAGAGVVVVSGLATGIDSAALRGALEVSGAPGPVAVLGTALDGRVTEPQRALATCIAGRGAVLSELAPGSHGARWRFAVRNRIMAALSVLVVVVECHAEGGALHTVRAARRRVVPVAAVPGSVQRPAAAGTNALLVDGAACVRHGSDVVQLVGRVTGRPLRLLPGPPATGERPTGGAGQRQRRSPDAPARRVLRSLEPEPLDLGRVVERSGLPFATVAAALEQLADLGLAEATGGWWRRMSPGRGRR